ncbi:hypothetical protein TBLA_0A07090 [Henningerozyma blattae CBS 6284]|uniref:Uncharacterized protein n=1 Tax=Henningerozyma blattae (strain ATCC 34711 / CBS 6284 / DSM 70876 / NBRC 10599 / NRRL Y-10934 / UCD 77-7) TaxID=1071380 RepID=I2GWJ8_HENB6|nr:hypothetical protein TBLA_0A07090 [Tetrapisispora blattae CBS 6284]CCH58500.1 hypothetical protein TBLA_0A07090 [Tetrapisispora blattae CBS 6284]
MSPTKGRPALNSKNVNISRSISNTSTTLTIVKSNISNRSSKTNKSKGSYTTKAGSRIPKSNTIADFKNSIPRSPTRSLSYSPKKLPDIFLSGSLKGEENSTHGFNFYIESPQDRLVTLEEQYNLIKTTRQLDLNRAEDSDNLSECNKENISPFQLNFSKNRKASKDTNKPKYYGPRSPLEDLPTLQYKGYIEYLSTQTAVELTTHMECEVRFLNSASYASPLRGNNGNDTEILETLYNTRHEYSNFDDTTIEGSSPEMTTTPSENKYADDEMSEIDQKIVELNDEDIHGFQNYHT